MKVPVILQANRWECGLACLAMLAGAHGYAIGIGEIRRRAGHSAQGATLGWLMELARLLGFHPRALRLDIEEASMLRTPCMLLWGTQHFVVLKRVGSRSWVIHDPAVGVRRYRRREVDRHFSGVALEVTPGAGLERAAPPARLRLYQLWSEARGLVRALIVVFLLSVTIQALALVSPLYVQLVVDDALGKHAADLLTVLAMAFGAIALLNALTGYLRAMVVLLAGNALNEQLTTNVYLHLLRLPLVFFVQRDIGDISARFGSLKPVLRVFTAGIVAVLIDGLLGITTIVLLFLYHAQLTLLVLMFLVAVFSVRLATLPRLRTLMTASIHKSAAEQTVFIESLRSILSLKANTMERSRGDLWRNCYTEVIGASAALGAFGARVDLLRGVLTGLENIIVVYAGASAVLDGDLTVGMLYAFIAYKSHFVRAMTDLLEQLVELRMLRLHLERLADIVLAEPGTRPFEEILLGVPFKGAIEMRGVSFLYTRAGTPAIDDVSIHVERGTEVGIVGQSGSGKSTLVKLLLGLIEPTTGVVLFDDARPLAVHRDVVSARTGVVLQGDSLFSGTIRDNVALFDLEVEHERVVECCRLAVIDSDIALLPMRYDTPLGDMGITLSAGQQQRLLVARALYKKPRLLILDEATANLDDTTRAQVNENLRGLGITVVRVTHRDDELERCDVVYRLERGKLRLDERSRIDSNPVRDLG